MSRWTRANAARVEGLFVSPEVVMGPLRELLATDHRQTLEFFVVRLQDLCEPTVDRQELLYNASLLAHYAQVSTQAHGAWPAPANLSVVFDHFVADTTLLHDLMDEMDGLGPRTERRRSGHRERTRGHEARPVPVDSLQPRSICARCLLRGRPEDLGIGGVRGGRARPAAGPTGGPSGGLTADREGVVRNWPTRVTSIAIS